MKLSLAGWSLHRLFRQMESPLQLVDFPKLARDRFGLDAVELNNVFFASRDSDYLRELVSAADRADVKLLNIAVDEKGDLSSPDRAQVELGLASYSVWIPIAAQMGIQVIRANSGGDKVADLPLNDPAREAAEKTCIESFKRLCDTGRKYGVTVLIENHWGLSSEPESVVRVVEGVRQAHGADAIGTLADWGNWPDRLDRYEALRRILPYARAVHAKVNNIDAELNHPRFDLARCVELTREAGYDGYLGIEYEGKDPPPLVGVERAVKKLGSLIGESR